MKEVRIGKQMFRGPLEIFSYHGTMGRSTATAICGFCDCSQRVYVWSLAGSGKRCINCKALLTSGGTFKPIKWIVREIFDGIRTDFDRDKKRRSPRG